MDWKEERREIRRLEKKFRRQKNMSANEGNVGNLKRTLNEILPPHMRPGNVGNLNSVTWPMWYQVDFDFGTNPSYTSNSRQTQSFQNTQEAAFLMMAISRKHYGYDEASALAPLQIEMRDRQSSRQFNNNPIPIQMIGRRNHPTTMPTPMLIMPNAAMDVTANTWLAAGNTMATTGSGKFQLCFFGYRIRVEDSQKVLSAIFG
jgi:hypothetical protein